MHKQDNTQSLIGMRTETCKSVFSQIQDHEQALMLICREEKEKERLKFTLTW